MYETDFVRFRNSRVPHIVQNYCAKLVSLHIIVTRKLLFRRFYVSASTLATVTSLILVVNLAFSVVAQTLFSM